MLHRRAQRGLRQPLRVPGYRNAASPSSSVRVRRSQDKLRDKAPLPVRVVHPCGPANAVARIPRVPARRECVRHLGRVLAPVLHRRRRLDAPWAVRRAPVNVMYRAA